MSVYASVCDSVAGAERLSRALNLIDFCFEALVREQHKDGRVG